MREDASPFRALLPVTLLASGNRAVPSIAELPFAAMLEVNAWDGRAREAVMHLLGIADAGDSGALPGPGEVWATGLFDLVQVAPRRILLIVEGTPISREHLNVPASIGTVTDQSHARLRLRLDGHAGTELLSRGISCDLRTRNFPAGRAKVTPLHGVPIILHRRAEDVHDLYLPRSFAVSQLELLFEFASTMGLSMSEPEQ